MIRRTILLLLTLLSALILHSCDDLFGSKDDSTTDEIFEEGRRDPLLAEDVVGYAALLPFWNGFNAPTDVHIGFDELAYVTDSDGLHVLDRAGREFRTIPFDGAVSVTQDRLLNVYVSARIDTAIEVRLGGRDTTITWNLAAIYKLRGANGAGDLVYLDTLIHPFMDDSRSTQAARLNRLNRDSPENDELVELTGMAVLSDNTLYVTRRGPKNDASTIEAPDNTVLEYSAVVVDGEETDQMRNVRQIRTINARTPSLISGLGMSSITTYIGPPQRNRFEENRSFTIAQADLTRDIPFRVLQVVVEETPDGLVYRPNTALVAQDTADANRFLYEQFRFIQPTDLAFAADGTNYIFVTDAGTDSLYQFQINGFEGVNPPPGSDADKPIIVSFGGTGSGPKEFDNPSGVSYFREVVFVADRGNNRICRYKLTTDFE